jgi:hypothetical protein
VKLLSRFFLGENSHLTYPHTNPFAFGGKGLIFSHERDGVRRLYHRDLTTHETTPLPDIGHGLPAGTFDIALKNSQMVAIVRDGVYLLDLTHPGKWEHLYQAPATATIDGLCSISADGGKILCREVQGESNRAIEIDVATGNRRTLFEKTWYANHFHYCTHDPAWIAFSHEGPANEIRDRCWIWNADQAPDGRVAFDQASDEPGEVLWVGHERWGAHDVSAYVIAYAISTAPKRGLYEVFGDGRPARLLWKSDVLWHCNMDPTGRYVVVDTTGPYAAGKLPPEILHQQIEDHLRADRERGRNISDVVLLDLQTGESLHLATVQRTQHPYHPHPTISPDCRWVAWNDANPQACGIWLASVAAANST